MQGPAVLVDSNILIRWVQLQDISHPIVDACLTRLVEMNATLYYTSQNLGEFWNVLTRPTERNGYGYSPRDADHLAGKIEQSLSLLSDSMHVHREWRQMLVDYGISGVQVHDARLVAAMRVHGVRRILTFNAKDFRRFQDVEAMLPQDVATARD